MIALAEVRRSVMLPAPQARSHRWRRLGRCSTQARISTYEEFEGACEIVCLDRPYVATEREITRSRSLR